MQLQNVLDLYETISAPYYLTGDLDMNSLYSYLKANRLDFYNANQRLIFVQKGDTYDLFGNDLGNSIAYLQQFLQEIDITNCFVHIVTGNTDITKELALAKEKFSTDQTEIEYTILDMLFEKHVKHRESFCLKAWEHLYVDPSANVRLCCMTDENHVLSRVKDTDAYHAANSEEFCNARQKMLANISIPSCKTCYDAEDVGLKSERQWFNEKWKHLEKHAVDNTDHDGKIKKYQPATAHVALSNVCNLMCRTCSGTSSSKLAREEKILFGLTKHFDNMLSQSDKENVYHNIIDTLQTTKKINFAGGEPMLQEEHYLILQQLIENQNTDISLSYHINGTTLSHKNYDICDMWNQFNDVRVDFSLDGMGKVFNYVRHGADWQTVENNFLIVKEKCSRVKLGVNSVISFLSIDSVMELQKNWHERGILDITRFTFGHMFENSDFYNIQTLPMHHKQRIAEKIDQHCNWLTEVNSPLVTKWQSMKSYMFAKDHQYVLHSLLVDLQKRDNHRKVNFFDVFPVYKDLFDNL